MKLTQKPADNEQLAQRLVISIQAIEEEIARGQSNLQMIEVQSQGLVDTTAAVKALKDHAPGDEMLVNIGSGVHLNVKLVDTSRVLTVIGAGFAAERTVDEALASFEERQKQLSDLANRQQEQIRKAQTQLEELRAQLNSLIQTQQQPPKQ